MVFNTLHLLPLCLLVIDQEEISKLAVISGVAFRLDVKELFLPRLPDIYAAKMGISLAMATFFML